MTDETKDFINKFYQPLGYLQCQVSCDEMWEYAKARALDMCLVMLEEHSCQTLNSERHKYWTEMERAIKAC